VAHIRRVPAHRVRALIALVLIEAWPSLALTPVWRDPPEMYRFDEIRPQRRAR
jgi:hypothetical protein